MSEKAQYRTRQITELENYLCSMKVNMLRLVIYVNTLKIREVPLESQRFTASLTGWWSRAWLPNMWWTEPAARASNIWDMMSIVISIYAFIANVKSAER